MDRIVILNRNKAGRDEVAEAVFERFQRPLERVSGNILAVGATSASLHHDDAPRMAGFNLYDVDDAGKLTNVEAHVFDPKDEAFHVESVPKLVA